VAEAAVVVVVVVVTLEAAEAAAFEALVSAELLTSGVAVLVHRTQPPEERPTVEVESGSALIILRR
jgi:xanthine/uracil permease